MSHTVVEVHTIPECDICREAGDHVKAAFDAKTVHGPWANLCPKHYDRLGYGLGLGKGQRLVKVGTHRCEALAKRGTGEGVCDALLDGYGACPRADRHLS